MGIFSEYYDFPGLQKALEKDKDKKPVFDAGVGQVNPMRGFLEAGISMGLGNRGVKEYPRYPHHEILREVERKNPIVGSVVNLRRRQMRPFAEHSVDDNMPGWRIILKDREAKPTAKQKKMMSAIALWFENAGRTDFEGWEDREDNLHDVITKLAYEYLTIDQIAIEFRRDRSGRPVDYWVLDGSTIRRVIEAGFQGVKRDIDTRAFTYADSKFYEELSSARSSLIPNPEDIRFVQVIQDKIVAGFTRKDLIFDTMQKVTSMRRGGMGYSPTEQAMGVITAFLWGMTYNSEQFNSGVLPKIALAFKDSRFSREQLISLQDEMIANHRGPAGAWRIPMLNGGVDVLDLYKNARDMEFMKYMEFVGSITGAVFSVDLAEVGLRFGQAQNVLTENVDAKQKHSKDRGLRDLLGAIQNIKNKIMRLAGWSMFEFRFTGISSEDQAAVSLLEDARVKRDTTVNELRKEKDKSPIPGGDIILDTVYIQALQAQQMAESEASAGGGEDGFDADEMVGSTIDDLFKAGIDPDRFRTNLLSGV